MRSSAGLARPRVRCEQSALIDRMSGRRSSLTVRPGTGLANSPRTREFRRGAYPFVLGTFQEGPAMASTNKYLAQMNKSQGGGNATNSCSAQGCARDNISCHSPTHGGRSANEALARSGGWGLILPVFDALIHDLTCRQSLPDPAPLGRDRTQARPYAGRATDPHGHRLFGTSWQSSKEGLNDRWWRTDASLLQCTLRDEGDRISAVYQPLAVAPL